MEYGRERKSSYKNLYIVVFIINTIYYGVGQSNVWTSPAVPHLREQLRGSEAWLVSCFALGQTLGPLISGCCMDSLGRKPTILLIASFLLASCLLLAVGASSPLLFCARVVGGFSFGMSVSVLPAYVAEIAHPQIRSTLNSFPLASRSLGYFTMYTIGPLVSYKQLVLLTSLAPLVTLLLLFCLQESPYHLVATGRPESARQAVQWLRAGASKQEVQVEIENIQEAVKEGQDSKTSFRDLFTSRANVRALYISCGLLFFLQMSGIPVIVAITESLFRLAQVTVPIHFCTSVFGALMLLVGLMGPAITRRFGYKGPLVLSALGMCLSLTVFGTHFFLLTLGRDLSHLSLVPIISLVTFISFYSLGFSNSAFAIVGELFAPNVKALGTSLVNSFGFSCAFLSIQLFYFIKSTLGVHFGLWAFAMTNAFAVVFVCFSVPDTSGMSLLEIQELLRGPWFFKRHLDVDVADTLKTAVYE